MWATDARGEDDQSQALSITLSMLLIALSDYTLTQAVCINHSVNGYGMPDLQKNGLTAPLPRSIRPIT